MCVRNAVIAACTTLEMACCDSLGLLELPDRVFKEGLKKALNDAGKTPIDFGSGLWQDVLNIQKFRNNYIHIGGKLMDLYPLPSAAEDAIKIIREAIHDIYRRMGKSSPKWVALDESGGWPQPGGFRMTGHLTVSRVGADPNAPDTYSIVLVTETGEEKPTIYLAGTTPEEDVFEEVEDLLGRLNVPFSAVRVYRGPDLIYEDNFDMGG